MQGISTAIVLVRVEMGLTYYDVDHNTLATSKTLAFVGSVASSNDDNTLP